MRRLFLIAATTALLSSTPALAQGPGMQAPVMTDLRKAPIGSWSDYKMNMNMQGQAMEMKARWALVERDSKTATIESRMEGGSLAAMGGQMLARMVLAADPTTDDKPIKKLIMKMGPNEPIEMPSDAPGLQTKRFSKPDPKKMVGKEPITVAGKAMATSHYRDDTGNLIVDTWVNESAYPLGVVKMTSKPKEGANGPTVTMELTAQGKGAKPELTQPAKPMDPAMLQMMRGARPPGGEAPAPAPATAPKKK